MEDNKKIFLIILCVGIIIHLFILTNKLSNWDDIYNLFSKGACIPLGRWFLRVTKYIFPNYSMPVFNGVISFILLSCSACLIVNIMEVKMILTKF